MRLSTLLLLALALSVTAAVAADNDSSNDSSDGVMGSTTTGTAPTADSNTDTDTDTSNGVTTTTTSGGGMPPSTTIIMAPSSGSDTDTDTENGNDGNKRANVIDFVDSKNDTTLAYQLIQAANLTDLLDDNDLDATVFIPTDEYLSALAMQMQEDLEANPELLVTILKYHVVPGKSYEISELRDGMVLQTLVEGTEGQLQVSLADGAKKPRLRTTSGQDVPIYQYDIEAGDARVDTIKGVLVPGNQTLQAGAGAPASAPTTGAMSGSDTDTDTDTDTSNGVTTTTTSGGGMPPSTTTTTTGGAAAVSGSNTDSDTGTDTSNDNSNDNDSSNDGSDSD